MFCHLYKLFERTGLKLTEFTECTDTCDYIKNNTCGICKKVSEKLTKEKYNWMIDTVIVFNPPKISKSGITKYLSVVTLIHPSHNDMYIVYDLLNNKVDNTWDPEFKLYFGGDIKNFMDISLLNSYLKKNGYPGRKLTINDFINNEKTESE